MDLCIIKAKARPEYGWRDYRALCATHFKAWRRIFPFLAAQVSGPHDFWSAIQELMGYYAQESL